MTLPDLIQLNDHNGNWERYENALYAIFNRDIVKCDLRFRGQKVNARRNPEHEQKWACFWHLISEGRVEDDRLPDLRRCERIQWVRWIVENADSDVQVDIWENKRKSQRNILLWYNEEYLVVLTIRKGYYLLKTAYCTDQSHSIRKLQRERNSAT